MRFQRRAALAASILTACCATAHAQQVTGNAFNPAISLILNGHYASYSRNPADWALSGFMLDRDAGLPTEGLYPKDVEAVMNEAIDLVVSVCDNARETCPVFPRPVPRLHLPFHDPHGEPLESFIAVRDDIRARLIPAVRAALGL